jgi:protein-S-isoprenylcysteine O-methyltransferase Ste14
MMMAARLLIPGLWLAWALIWLVMALRVKPVAWRESRASRIVNVIPLILAWWLMVARRLPAWLMHPWHDPSRALHGLGASLVAAGLLLAIWARLKLGGNWSGMVTLKEGHEIVRTGPYRWIRHPIYSGLLLALIGSAVALGQWRGPVAVLLVAAAFWGRIRLEERRLGEHFGPAYAAYRRTTWALIPLVY